MIGLLRKGNKVTPKRITEREIYSVILTGCAMYNFFYILIFAYIGLEPLVYFNVLSTLFYVVLKQIMIRRNASSYIVYGIYIMVTIHTAAHTLLLGPLSGFQMFLFCLVPSCFYVEYIRRARFEKSYFFCAVSIVLFLLLRLLPSRLGLDAISLEDHYIDFIYVYNALIAFGMMGSISVYFIMDIKTDREGLEKQNNELSQLANIDPLTKLANRRSIKRSLELALEAKEKMGVEFTIAICDIDDFKKFNDKYGHDCGDYVLQNVAEIIRSNVRETDCVCRWGGEEILILFTHSELDEAKKIIERIHGEVSDGKMEYQGQTVGVTMTIGICSSKEHLFIQDMILEADEYMYKGKKLGKNQIVIC